MRKTLPRDSWLSVAAAAAVVATVWVSAAGPRPLPPEGESSRSAETDIRLPLPLPAPPPTVGARDEGRPLEPAFDWSMLKGYAYREGLAGLPDEIRALDGRRVTARGFLMPIYEFDDIHEFSLVPDHFPCCFGEPATLSGQVHVRVSGRTGLDPTSDALRVTGTFRVREVKEAGYVLAIWTIEDASVTPSG